MSVNRCACLRDTAVVQQTLGFTKQNPTDATRAGSRHVDVLQVSNPAFFMVVLQVVRFTCNVYGAQFRAVSLCNARLGMFEGS